MSNLQRQETNKNAVKHLKIFVVFFKREFEYLL